MTKAEVQLLLSQETKLWDRVFGFRALDWDYVQLWISRDQPIARTLKPYLIELPSKSGYVWNPECDGEVVPVLVAYRDSAIQVLNSWASGASK